MESLFVRLSTSPAETTKIRWILKKFKPEYANHLVLGNHQTVEDLVKDAKILEESIMGRCSLGIFDGISDNRSRSSPSTRFASTSPFNRNFSNNIQGDQQNSRFSNNYRPPRRINEVSGISSSSGYNEITRRANGRTGDGNEGVNTNQSQSHANDTGSSSRDAYSRNAQLLNCGSQPTFVIVRQIEEILFQVW
ncbi:hypothetical protein JTB14_006436 [Gonioctena quinquepunctata]|nr:hypothetical protein JTB14_006436 [Gonioctena quinquepunctata]